MEMISTYNITDDKLKVWFKERLTTEQYQEITRARLRWWPGSKCFAGKWNVYAEDIILRWGGTIDEDDTPDDVEARVERFNGRAVRAENEAEASQQYLEARANTERRKTQAANRIDRSLGEASHWNRRVAAAISHAARKGDPGVIARRIKDLEASHRKHSKAKAISETLKKLWTAPELSTERAMALARLLMFGITIEGQSQSSAYSHLKDGTAPVHTVVAAVVWHLDADIAFDRRLAEHAANRLVYEQANLEAAGGLPGSGGATGVLEIGGAARCARSFGELSEIIKITAQSVRLKVVPVGRFSHMPVRANGVLVKRSELREVISKAEWEAKKAQLVGAES